MKKKSTVLAVLLLSSTFLVSAQNIGDLGSYKKDAENLVSDKTKEIKAEAEKKSSGAKEEWKTEKAAFKAQKVDYKAKKVSMRSDVKELRGVFKSENGGTSSLSEVQSKAKKLDLASKIEKQRDELKTDLKFKEDYLASLKGR